MKWLIACEESQTVTKAFRALGIDAYSCDLQDCSGGHHEWHIRGDAIAEAYSGKYDGMIAHPPCTYLANSGVRWLNIVDGVPTNQDRITSMFHASVFFRKLLNAPVDFVVIENPIPHKHAKIPKYDQLIQPWQFGHGETKATCLWLKGLPKLEHTNIVSGREQRIWKMSPGPDRTKERSKTFPGIASAMAEQWGKLLIESKQTA